MPAYEYELLDPDTGAVLATATAVRPIPERDRVRVRRRTVPGTVRVMGSAGNPYAAERCVLRGYHRQEEKLGSRFKSQFSAEQVKRSFKVTPAPLQADN